MPSSEKYGHALPAFLYSRYLQLISLLLASVACAGMGRPACSKALIAAFVVSPYPYVDSPARRPVCLRGGKVAVPSARGQPLQRWHDALGQEQHQHSACVVDRLDREPRRVGHGLAVDVQAPGLVQDAADHNWLLVRGQRWRENGSKGDATRCAFRDEVHGSVLQEGPRPGRMAVAVTRGAGARFVLGEHAGDTPRICLEEAAIGARRRVLMGDLGPARRR